MSVVILEGIDGAGKSTLAESLAATFNAVIFPVGAPNNAQRAFAEYYHHLERTKMYPRVIFDRFHWGSFVYGHLFREGCDLLPFEWYHLENLLMNRRAMVFHVAPEPQWAIENLNKRDTLSEYEDSDKVRRASALFDEVRRLSSLPVETFIPPNDKYISVENAVARRLQWQS